MQDTPTPAIHRQPIRPPAAWRGDRLRNEKDWLIEFTPAQIDEIDAALRFAKENGLTAAPVHRDSFPLPTLGPELHAHLKEVESGRGFVVLRGLPTDRYSDEDCGTIFSGLGSYLGRAVAQNPAGDMLGHVHDQGRKFGALNVRGYETNAHLPFHGDGCDVVGLLCLHKAKAGGLSSLVSAMELHNQVLQRRPDLLPVLYRGYYYINREAAHTDHRISRRRFPVFGSVDGLTSCYFNPPKIEAAFKASGVPPTTEEREALDLMNALAQDPELHLDIDLEFGDIQFCNNYLILHSRTEFEDWPAPRPGRHMLRLWLTFDQRRVVPQGFARLDGYVPNQLASLSDQ